MAPFSLGSVVLAAQRQAGQRSSLNGKVEHLGQKSASLDQWCAAVRRIYSSARDKLNQDEGEPDNPETVSGVNERLVRAFGQLEANTAESAALVRLKRTFRAVRMSAREGVRARMVCAAFQSTLDDLNERRAIEKAEREEQARQFAEWQAKLLQELSALDNAEDEEQGDEESASRHKEEAQPEETKEETVEVIEVLNDLETILGKLRSIQGDAELGLARNSCVTEHYAHNMQAVERLLSGNKGPEALSARRLSVAAFAAAAAALPEGESSAALGSSAAETEDGSQSSPNSPPGNPGASSSRSRPNLGGNFLQATPSAPTVPFSSGPTNMAKLAEMRAWRLARPRSSTGSSRASFASLAEENLSALLPGTPSGSPLGDLNHAFEEAEVPRDVLGALENLPKLSKLWSVVKMVSKVSQNCHRVRERMQQEHVRRRCSGLRSQPAAPMEALVKEPAALEPDPPRPEPKPLHVPSSAEPAPAENVVDWWEEEHPRQRRPVEAQPSREPDEFLGSTFRFPGQAELPRHGRYVFHQATPPPGFQPLSGPAHVQAHPRKHFRHRTCPLASASSREKVSTAEPPRSAQSTPSKRWAQPVPASERTTIESILMNRKQRGLRTQCVATPDDTKHWQRYAGKLRLGDGL